MQGSRAAQLYLERNDLAGLKVLGLVHDAIGALAERPVLLNLLVPLHCYFERCDKSIQTANSINGDFGGLGGKCSIRVPKSNRTSGHLAWFAGIHESVLQCAVLLFV